MAPGILRRTPHSADLLDRTGIISASVREAAEHGAVEEGQGPPAHRSRLAGLAAVALMFAVAFSGGAGQKAGPVTVEKSATNREAGRPSSDGIPVASSPNPSSRSPDRHDGSRGSTERTPVPTEPSEEVELSVSRTPPPVSTSSTEAESPAPGIVEHVPVQMLRDDRREPPASQAEAHGTDSSSEPLRGSVENPLTGLEPPPAAVETTRR